MSSANRPNQLMDVSVTVSEEEKEKENVVSSSSSFSSSSIDDSKKKTATSKRSCVLSSCSNGDKGNNSNDDDVKIEDDDDDRKIPTNNNKNNGIDSSDNNATQGEDDDAITIQPGSPEITSLLNILLSSEGPPKLLGLKWTAECEENFRRFAATHYELIESLIGPYQARPMAKPRNVAHHTRCSCDECKIRFSEAATMIFEAYYHFFGLGEKKTGGGTRNHAPLWLLMKLSLEHPVVELLLHKQGRDNSCRWRQVLLDKIRQLKKEIAKGPQETKLPYEQRRSNGHQVKRRMLEDPSYEPTDEEKANLALALKQQVHLDKWLAKGRAGAAVRDSLAKVREEAEATCMDADEAEEKFLENLNDEQRENLAYIVDKNSKNGSYYRDRKAKVDELKYSSSTTSNPGPLAAYLSTIYSASATHEARLDQTAEMDKTLALVERPTWTAPNNRTSAIQKRGIKGLVDKATSTIESKHPDGQKSTFNRYRGRLGEKFDDISPHLVWQAILHLLLGFIPVGLLVLAFTDGTMVYGLGSIRICHVLKDVHIVYHLLEYAQKVRDFAYGGKRLKGSGVICNDPTIHVDVTFGPPTRKWKEANGKSYVLYSGVVPDKKIGPSLEELEELGWKIHRLRKEIQAKVKETNGSVSISFLEDAVAEAEFTENKEKDMFHKILACSNGGDYQAAFRNLSNGYVYASARGSCACWWMFVVVLFHLGCSHYIIFVFNSFLHTLPCTLVYLAAKSPSLFEFGGLRSGQDLTVVCFITAIMESLTSFCLEERFSNGSPRRFSNKHSRLFISGMGPKNPRSKMERILHV